MSQFPNPTGFRPELGLPWFNYTMQGLSEAELVTRCKGLVSFRFPDARMAPFFPKHTQVVLRPVSCKCKLVVGKVYVLLTKGGEFIAYGRLTELEESEELDRYGVRLTLCWADGREAMAPWLWPHPGYVLYALAYYGSVEVTAL